MLEREALVDAGSRLTSYQLCNALLQQWFSKAFSVSECCEANHGIFRIRLCLVSAIFTRPGIPRYVVGSNGMSQGRMLDACSSHLCYEVELENSVLRFAMIWELIAIQRPLDKSDVATVRHQDYGLLLGPVSSTHSAYFGILLMGFG